MLGGFPGRLDKIKNNWPTIAIIILLILACLFLFRLGSAPAGYSKSEVVYHSNTSAINSILNNSVNLPHKLLSYGFIKAGWAGREPLRLVSIVFAAFLAFCFYIVSKNLFGKIVGLLSTLVFCLTPFFIVAARQSTPDILYFAPIILMAGYGWLVRTEKNRNIAWICLALLAGVFIYVPGMIWWLAGSVFICRKKLGSAISEVPTWAIAIGVAIFTVLLVPAAYSIAKDTAATKDFLLLPQHLAPLVEMLKRTGWMIAALVVKTPYHDQLIVGRVPFLDIIQLVLLVFGVYAMLAAAKGKAAALAASIGFAIVAAAVNANLHLLALGLPAIGLFMAAGLRYLYIEWRGIFPCNPIPKTMALALMIILVSVQSIYGISYGLVAWPHAAQTKADYVLK